MGTGSLVRIEGSWSTAYFQGDRLAAEVRLQASVWQASIDERASLERELQQLHRSHGRALDETGKGAEPIGKSGLGALEHAYQQAGHDRTALRQLFEQSADYPDPLLLWAIRFVLPTASDPKLRRAQLQRLIRVLQQRFPARLDLLLALVMSEGSSDLLKGLPALPMPASAYYSNVQVCLMYLQGLWTKGRYAQLLLSYLNYQLYHRWFPSSDYVLRGYTIIGLIDRVDLLFRAIYRRHTAEVQPVSLSNMLFTALGLESLDAAYVAQLVDHWRRLTREPAITPAQPPSPKRLQVNEKPTLVVVSADLRMHPVGRFWLPLAQSLRNHFRLVHLGFNPHDSDPIRDQLKACSEGWHLLECTAKQETETLLHQLQPDLLLDLGGHTADNRPGLLNQRLAPVQATYLGFYGPSYGEQCDWWILDPAIARRVQHSYPGREAIWELPGPSLCYDPTSHGLPLVDEIVYSEPDHAVIGSFNHTRKLTGACIERFGAVLQAMPEAVLQFRSHSFFDPAVRRWFVRQFVDAGIAPEQLQPLPYAPSGKDALKDYGRIHLHLDSYPVSGTTTTLDSLAMGIPVLTCPNHLYAGAISAAILEHAGLSEMVCERPDDLPEKAKQLCAAYSSAIARRALARRVRQSPLCDTSKTAEMFASSLGEMLRRGSGVKR